MMRSAPSMDGRRLRSEKRLGAGQNMTPRRGASRIRRLQSGTPTETMSRGVDTTCLKRPRSYQDQHEAPQNEPLRGSGDTSAGAGGLGIYSRRGGSAGS